MPVSGELHPFSSNAPPLSNPFPKWALLQPPADSLPIQTHLQLLAAREDCLARYPALQSAPLWILDKSSILSSPLPPAPFSSGEQLAIVQAPLFLPSSAGPEVLEQVLQSAYSKLLVQAVQTATASGPARACSVNLPQLSSSFLQYLLQHPGTLVERALEAAADLLSSCGLESEAAQAAYLHFDHLINQVKIRRISIEVLATATQSLSAIPAECISNWSLLDPSLTKQEALQTVRLLSSGQGRMQDSKAAASLAILEDLLQSGSPDWRPAYERTIRQLAAQSPALFSLFEGNEILLPAIEQRIHAHLDLASVQQTDSQTSYKLHVSFEGLQPDAAFARMLLCDQLERAYMLERQEPALLRVFIDDLGHGEYSIQVSYAKSGPQEPPIILPASMIGAFSYSAIRASEIASKKSKNSPWPAPDAFDPRGFYLRMGFSESLSPLFANSMSAWEAQEGFIPQPFDSKGVIDPALKASKLDPTIANLGYMLSIKEMEQHPADMAGIYLKAFKYGSVTTFAINRLQAMSQNGKLSAQDVQDELDQNMPNLIFLLTGKTPQELDALTPDGRLRRQTENLLRQAMLDYAIDKDVLQPGQEDLVRSLSNSQLGRSVGAVANYYLRDWANTYNFWENALDLASNWIAGMKNSRGFEGGWVSSEGGTRVSFFLSDGPIAKPNDSYLELKLSNGLGFGFDLNQRLFASSLGRLPFFEQNRLQADFHFSFAGLTRAGGNPFLLETGLYSIGGQGFKSVDELPWLLLGSASGDIRTVHKSDALQITTLTTIQAPPSTAKLFMPSDFKKGFEETGPALPNDPLVVTTLQAQSRALDVFGQSFSFSGGGRMNWNSKSIKKVYAGVTYNLPDGKGFITLLSGAQGLTGNLNPFVGIDWRLQLNKSISLAGQWGRDFLPYGSGASISSFSIGISAIIPTKLLERPPQPEPPPVVISRPDIPPVRWPSPEPYTPPFIPLEPPEPVQLPPPELVFTRPSSNAQTSVAFLRQLPGLTFSQAADLGTSPATLKSFPSLDFTALSDIQTSASLPKTLPALSFTPSSDLQSSSAALKSLPFLDFTALSDIQTSASLLKTLPALSFTTSADLQSSSAYLKSLPFLSFTTLPDVQTSASSLKTLPALSFTTSADLQSSSAALKSLPFLSFTTLPDVQTSASSLKTLPALDFTPSADLQSGTSPLKSFPAMSFGDVPDLQSGMASLKGAPGLLFETSRDLQSGIASAKSTPRITFASSSDVQTARAGRKPVRKQTTRIPGIPLEWKPVQKETTQIPGIPLEYGSNNRNLIRQLMKSRNYINALVYVDGSGSLGHYAVETAKFGVYVNKAISSKPNLSLNLERMPPVDDPDHSGEVMRKLIGLMEQNKLTNSDIILITDLQDCGKRLTRDEAARFINLAKQNLVRCHVLYLSSSTPRSSDALPDLSTYQKLCPQTGGCFQTIEFGDVDNASQSEVQKVVTKEGEFILSNMLSRQSILSDLLSINSLTDSIVMSKDYSYLEKITRLGRMHANIDFKRLTDPGAQKQVLDHIRLAAFNQVLGCLASSSYSRRDAASTIAALWSVGTFFESVRAILYSNIPQGAKTALLKDIQSKISPSSPNKSKKTEIVRSALSGNLVDNL